VAAEPFAEHPAHPGTSSVAHLRENAAAAALALPTEELATLDAIGA